VPNVRTPVDVYAIVEPQIPAPYERLRIFVGEYAERRL